MNSEIEIQVMRIEGGVQRIVQSKKKKERKRKEIA